ncbi:hypothetical protein AU495_09955 [Lonsdalea populi]|nr:hypothetical protein AU495_09955 [Lonsdalea populi]
MAATRGHKVTLFEKTGYLGGQFRSAAFPPGKGELATYTAWLGRELEKLGVEIKFNTPLTKEIVAESRPDSVIVATGGKPAIPPIKGINQPHVVLAEDVLLGNVVTGQRVIIAGGGEVGGETAAHLAMQLKDVTVVEMRGRLLQELDGVSKLHLMSVLEEYDVKQYPNTKLCEIGEHQVTLENAQGRMALEADTVVIALGYAPVKELAEELEGVADNVVVIGGAVKTSNALVAAREGFDAGMCLA